MSASLDIQVSCQMLHEAAHSVRSTAASGFYIYDMCYDKTLSYSMGPMLAGISVYTFPVMLQSHDEAIKKLHFLLVVVL